jgi:hypothetical protein
MGMGSTAAHGNAHPQSPSASILTLCPTTPKPDKSEQLLLWNHPMLFELVTNLPGYPRPQDGCVSAAVSRT